MLNKCFLENEYINNKKTAKQIAIENNTTRSVICNLLNKYGIKKSKKYNIKKIGRLQTIFTKDYLIEEHINKDKSLRKISKENNTSCGIVGKYLKKFNIHKKTYKNLIGKKFGKLLVIDVKIIKNKKPKWICECDCDSKNRIEATTNQLENQDKRSCGCLRHQKPYNWNGYGDISGDYFSSIIRGAKSRDIYIDEKITPEYLWNLFLKQDKKCSLSGVKLSFGQYDKKTRKKRDRTASLDRIDSSKGYIKDNIQWIHKSINRMKQNFSESDFIGFCNLISDYAKKNGKVGNLVLYNGFLKF